MPRRVFWLCHQKYLLDIEEISFPDAEFAVKYIESQRIMLNKEKIGVKYLYGDSMPLNYYKFLEFYRRVPALCK